MCLLRLQTRYAWIFSAALLYGLAADSRAAEPSVPTAEDGIDGAKLGHCSRPPAYPMSAHNAGHEGTTTVGFSVDERGVVVRTWVAESSGDADLDTASRSHLLGCRGVAATNAAGAATRSHGRLEVVWALEGKEPFRVVGRTALPDWMANMARSEWMRDWSEWGDCKVPRELEAKPASAMDRPPAQDEFAAKARQQLMERWAVRGCGGEVRLLMVLTDYGQDRLAFSVWRGEKRLGTKRIDDARSLRYLRVWLPASAPSR